MLLGYSSEIKFENKIFLAHLSGKEISDLRITAWYLTRYLRLGRKKYLSHCMFYHHFKYSPNKLCHPLPSHMTLYLLLFLLFPKLVNIITIPLVTQARILCAISGPSLLLTSLVHLILLILLSNCLLKPALHGPWCQCLYPGSICHCLQLFPQVVLPTICLPHCCQRAHVTTDLVLYLSPAYKSFDG